MMGHRVKLGGAEMDFIYARRYYGHKAGGATIYVKKSSTHKERRRAERDLRRFLKLELRAEMFDAP